MTTKVWPRVLLVSSALGLAAGGIVHAAPFASTVRVIDASDLSTFYANAYKALWLVDSAVLIIIAAVFGIAAWRPAAVGRVAIMLLALVPLVAAALLYVFVGNFFAAHLLTFCGVAGIAAACDFTRHGSLRIAER